MPLVYVFEGLPELLALLFLRSPHHRILLTFAKMQMIVQAQTAPNSRSNCAWSSSIADPCAGRAALLQVPVHACSLDTWRRSLPANETPLFLATSIDDLLQWFHALASATSAPRPPPFPRGVLSNTNLLWPPSSRAFSVSDLMLIARNVPVRWFPLGSVHFSPGISPFG